MAKAWTTFDKGKRTRMLPRGRPGIPRPFRNKGRIVGLAVALLTAIAVIGLPAGTANATNNFDNAAIADQGLARVGQWGGQCKQFANNMVSAASAGTVSIGGGYYASYSNAGGVLVSAGASVKGDIIQLNNMADRETYYNGMHTAIVVSYQGNNTFDVVDSNWGTPLNNEIVHHHTWNPFTTASQYGLTVNIWRLGTVTLAPTVQDFSGDGVRSDLAWDQGGTLYLLTGQSNGTFNLGGSTGGIAPATWAGGGAFRGNGKSQVVSYNASTGTISEFEWNGTSWAWINATSGIGSPSWVAVGDYNGDGRDDLAWDQGGTLFLLIGQTNGTFSLGGSTGGIGTATWVGGGNFRSDGRGEVVSYSAATGVITEFEWSGSAWYVAGSTSGIGSPDRAVAGLFDGDSRFDLAWDQGGTLYLLTGQSNGTFNLGGSTAGIGPATLYGAADFRGSGKWQVASYDSGTGTISEFEWNGSAWAWMGNTTGIGNPDFAVASR